MSDYPGRYRVAVTVFAEVEATESGQAAYAARVGVKQALLEAARHGDPRVIHAGFPGNDHTDVTIVEVVETDVALHSGYFTVQPASKVYRSLERERGEEQED